MSESVAPRWAGRELHFIGVGGAGMSGLAAVCHAIGAKVRGSDRAASSYTARLDAIGIPVTVGHAGENVSERAEVVVSTAIDEANPELSVARERGQSIIRRGELLAELCAEKRLVAVSGAHGKTTTSAMIAWALRKLGLEPAFFIGGEVPFPSGTANAGWGAGEWVIAEADESDASFLDLRSEIAVVTGIELDHHTRWGTEHELRKAFAEFVDGVGTIVAGPGVDLEGTLAPDGSSAPTRTVTYDEHSPGPPELRLSVPGRHNRLNARGAIAALSMAGLDPDEVAAALGDFPGVKRRLEFKGERRGARIYDDYAHHPTEVAAALEALYELMPRRLVAVFQPHLYSRTKALAADFGAALARADVIAVLDIYPAREEPVGDLAGVSGLDVVRAATDRAGGKPVWWLPTLEVARTAVDDLIEDGDIVVTLGAGDITILSDELAHSQTAASVG